jgi:hypothetical protein
MTKNRIDKMKQIKLLRHHDFAVAFGEFLYLRFPSQINGNKNPIRNIERAFLASPVATTNVCILLHSVSSYFGIRIGKSSCGDA